LLYIARIMSLTIVAGQHDIRVLTQQRAAVYVVKDLQQAQHSMPSVAQCCSIMAVWAEQQLAALCIGHSLQSRQALVCKHTSCWLKPTEQHVLQAPSDATHSRVLTSATCRFKQPENVTSPCYNKYSDNK
jgi:hypothetical protein